MDRNAYYEETDIAGPIVGLVVTCQRLLSREMCITQSVAILYVVDWSDMSTVCLKSAK